MIPAHEQNKLKEMALGGCTQIEMSETFNISLKDVQYYLNKLNLYEPIKRERRKRRVLKYYIKSNR